MESASKILLIDDDQALLKTYQKLFTLKGFDINYICLFDYLFISS